MRLRQVVKVVTGRETAGALDHLDPFLLLDEFKSEDAGGGGHARDEDPSRRACDG